MIKIDLHSTSGYTMCLLLFFLAVCCIGCGTVKVSKAEQPPLETRTIADTTALPLLPAEAIYMIGQEWTAVFDSTSAKFYTPRAEQIRNAQTTMEEFVEERLRELYPASVYPGYVEKVARLSEMLIRRAFPSSTIQNYIGEELPYDAAPSEWVDMEETAEERQRWLFLDSVAMQADWVEKAVTDTLISEDGAQENLALSLLLRYGPRMFRRVIQSKVRAEQFAQQYYGEETSAGKRGDAFKHIYVNALLRKYTNRFVAWVVMDVYWENAHPNAPCDHYMDAHNNVVGRNTHYEQITQTDDTSALPSWQQWAENVHLFIEDTAQNSSFQHWDRETPSFIVIENEKQASNKQYIYWNKGEL